MTIPISYTIDAEHGLVLSIGRGIVTARELFEYLDDQVDDPAVPLPLRDLHDLSRVERLEPVGHDLEKIIEDMRHDPMRFADARLAIVAIKDHVFGMSRMFQLLTEHSPMVEELRQKGLGPEAKVFRDHAEAREWLLAARQGGSRTPPHA